MSGWDRLLLTGQGDRDPAPSLEWYAEKESDGYRCERCPEENPLVAVWYAYDRDAGGGEFLCEEHRAEVLRVLL